MTALPQRLLTAGCLALACTTGAGAEPLREPPVLSSRDGVLDVLMLARATPLELGGVRTTGWTYEVCMLPAADATACPPGTAAPYGGVRLALDPGDRLRVRFINALPPIPCGEADHAVAGDQGARLLRNPTNIHTHGLIVEPRRATPALPTYGDYSYVIALNPANRAPRCAAPAAAGRGGHAHHDTAGAAHAGHDSITDVVAGPLQYEIDIPRNHPSGLFWFHPHVHGLALNQVSAGLSGLITVGAIGDSVCDGNATDCGDPAARMAVRHLTLKDTQVERAGSGPDGTARLLTQQDPGFCHPNPRVGDAPRQGACPGVGPHARGNWFHTVNGQVYPRVAVGAAGEIWRILNAGASRSYRLSLEDAVTGVALPMQVLSIDGIVPHLPAGAGPEAQARALGGRIDAVGCPVVPEGRGAPVCATAITMMPSSRTEIWVGRQGTAGARAVLRTTEFATGERPADADRWPAMDLAEVVFAPEDAGRPALAGALSLRGGAVAALAPGGIFSSPAALRMPGAERPVDLATARRLHAQARPGPLPAGVTLADSPRAMTEGVRLGLDRDAACRALPAGHRRRILFGNPEPGTDGFGLGYEEIDADGRRVGGSRRGISTFDADEIAVCLTLGGASGLDPVEEEWELVNLTQEDHNFHMHQVRFRLVTDNEGRRLPAEALRSRALQDNVRLVHGRSRPGTVGCDGTRAAWNQGACVSAPVVVRIRFREVGDFMYHCHILEHEDGGMMARIRVVPGVPALADARVR